MKQDQRQDEIVSVLAFENRENHHLNIGRRKLKEQQHILPNCRLNL